MSCENFLGSIKKAVGVVATLSNSHYTFAALQPTYRHLDEESAQLPVDSRNQERNEVADSQHTISPLDTLFEQCAPKRN